MKILCYLFFSILFYQYGNSTISIDSVKKTDSRCSNSGSITVYANTTNVFYNYEIGSNISSPQSSNTFLGLASGTYKVKITNVANEVDSTYVTISSTYTFPNFNQSVLPTTCKNNSDGKVIGKPVINSGVKPYLWTLKNNNNGSTITQLSDTFTNLISGDYTLTMSDSCLNTTVHNFVLSNTVPSIGINFSSINKINCRKIYFRSYVTFGTQYSPTIVKYKYLNTEIIKTAKVVSNYINDTFDMDYKSNENVSITIYNSCGDSATTSYTNNKYVLVQNAYKVGCDSVKYEIYSNAEVSTGFVKSKNGLILLSNLNAGSNDVIIPNMSYQDTINFSFITICNDTLKNTFNGRNFNSLYRISSNIYLDSCREKYSYQLQKQTEFFSINLVNVKLINKSTRIVLKDTNINSSVNLLFKNYPSNTDYTVLLTDKCGVQDSLSFYWNSPYPKILGCNFSIQNYTGCVDSTATIAIYHSGFASFAKIANFTGPKIAKSTKPKYSYSDSFVYKDSLLKANIDNYFYIRNLSVGKYSYRISDTCGNVLDTFFNIDVEDISNNFYEYSIVKACQDNNRLKLKLFSIPINYNNKYATGSFSIYDVQNNKYLRNKTGISFNHTSYIAFFDSFDYLSAGKYILKINRISDLNCKLS